jgi:hypothetical protein
MEEVKAFECKYCKDLFKKRETCKKHEDHCWMNPNVPDGEKVPF